MASMYLADNGKLVRFDREPYGQEKQLQDLLSTFPGGGTYSPWYP